MELERLSVALRPRTHWEALDLGVRLGIRHARPLYAAWFAVTLPTAAVLCLIFSLWLGDIALAISLMWWLKPAFDRVAVHVISHTVFGETPSVRATLRTLPNLLWNSRLLAALTWGRFSMTRSIQLPVDVLEGLRGRAARQRKALLGRRISGAARWQTIIWLHLEGILWLGLLGLIAMLIPQSMWPDFESLGQMFTHAPWWFSLLLNLPLLLCSLLLEPLYVAGGFMLYIKRRTDLEAWDVELQLRRLNRAHAAERASALTSSFVGLLLCLTIGFGAMAPHPALAADSVALREQAVERSAQEIKSVMQDPAFGKEEADRELRWRDDKKKKNEPSKLPDWLKGVLDSIASAAKWVGNAFAMLGRVGGWVLILSVVAILVYLISRFGWMARRGTRYVPPAELAGFDIRPQSLPDDIAGAALKLARNGDTRAALSLLFRGTLSRLAHQEQVPFARGDTEGDCLGRVRQHTPARSAFLARLLGCWQRLAYAHQEIGAHEIETLCQEWWREFGGGARE
ncbi:DUF4129 domain-containing protein [Uliginosibacterium flavum]|uniref:DUF4129 domain-containing protein n=1 Tax=Uliginosibacterium flavum TaxID=1396831 RepID=A0ABV2TKV7_9RHOO